MKKILYIFAILIGFGLSSCSEADNLAGAPDTIPAVTIYISDTIPANTDPETTVSVRFVPSLLCDKYYILAEKKVEKDAFIDLHGESAYLDRVIEIGDECLPNVKDSTYTTLAGIYAITAIGVSSSGVKGKHVYALTNGVEYYEVGNALYSDNSFSPNYTIVDAPARWYKSVGTQPTLYRMIMTISAWGNYPREMKLSWDENGALTFYKFGQKHPDYNGWLLTTPFTHPTYGPYLQFIDLDPESSSYNSATNTINLLINRAVSAGVFDVDYSATIVLP